MLYALKFEPVYKNIIWGGRNLERLFYRSLPDGNIAESWELCSRSDGMSIISNGFLKGRSIDSIINEYGTELLGHSILDSEYSQFPLLIKLIDANDKLSVQVHPDDEYARINENGEYGKTEMWYVSDCDEGAALYVGFKDTSITREEYIKALNEDRLPEILNRVEVKKGDTFFIPAGTVHALGKALKW